MFLEIFSFELKMWLKKPATYIFFSIFFLLSFFIVLIAGGAFPGLATGGNKDFLNSAVAIAGLTNGINFDLIGLMIIIGVIAPAVYKDFQYNTHSLLFTKPISKAAYFFGRFSGALFVSLIILCGSLFGHMLACFFPGLNSDNIGPFSFYAYVQTFLFFYLPNIFICGTIFFSVTTFTRNLMAGYMSALLLVIMKSVMRSLGSDLEYEQMSALIEPFGELALSYDTKFWTLEEQNTRMLSFSQFTMYNRLLWIGVSSLITFISYKRFSLVHLQESFKLFKREKGKNEIFPAHLENSGFADLPVFNPNDSLMFQLKLIYDFGWNHFLYIVKSIFFIVLVLLGVFWFVLSSSVLGSIYGTTTYPVTYNILELGAGIFQFFLLLMIVFYSGTLIWRERDAKMDELVGSAPISNATLFLSKLFALKLLIVVMMLVIMFSGIGMQLYQGFTDFNLSHYFVDLFVIRLVSFVLMAAMCLFIQVLVNQKFVGYVVAVFVLIIIPLILNQMEWGNQMLHFNSSGPGLPYSDMNGYGHRLFPWLIFKSYWFFFTLCLIVLSVLFYVRSKEKGLKYRLRVFTQRMNRKIVLILISSLICFASFGAFIYYNTHILNEYTTPKQQEELLSEYEKKFKRYSSLPPLRIVSLNADVAIYPKELRAEINGFYYLKNKGSKAVDTLFVLEGSDTKVTKFQINSSAKEVLRERDYDVVLYKFDKAVQPGDSVKIDFTVLIEQNGFPNSGLQTSIVENGTFFNSGILPHFGYFNDAELTEESVRKKYGLKPRAAMPEPNDSVGRMNTYIANDADWIRFESTVSTAEDQIAIAPGYLQKSWKENGRAFYHYKMDSPILYFVSWLSAHYEVLRDKWNDVSIEIYYQKGHEYNLQRMVKGIKHSLTYFTKEFSPYQHRQVRILEFPRYATFAQSFPNTIPFSEGIGFIAKVENDPLSIDYIYYVTAHEVAHQWWAHQVIGGKVKGCTVMSETMSQYSALMVMEKEYGKESMQKFLKYEMDHYLTGRTNKQGKEKPLMYNENQQYIHYNKGSVIMYALRDYIGEDSLNAALRRYIRKVAYQEPLYTNSIEFVNEIKSSTPDSLKYIIDDMFARITLFENRVTAFDVKEAGTGKYKVTLDVECQKFYSDSTGKQTDVSVNDWIDIGFFIKDVKDKKAIEKVIYLKKHKITKKNQRIEIILNEKPNIGGIDPYNKLIDRGPDNNRLKLGDKPSKAVLTDSGNISVGVSVDD